MLNESIEAIRALFSGEMVTYRGDHITVEDARLFSMPATPPPIAVAGSGAQSVELAARLGDAFISTAPDEAIMTFVDAGYDEVCVVQVGDDKDGFFRFRTDELAPRLAKAAGRRSDRAAPATPACTTGAGTAGLGRTRTWLSW